MFGPRTPIHYPKKKGPNLRAFGYFDTIRNRSCIFIHIHEQVFCNLNNLRYKDFLHVANDLFANHDDS